MEITIRNQDTGETYKTKSVRSLNTLCDDYGKYFNSRGINKVIASKETDLPAALYGKALAYDVEIGEIVEDKPQTQSTQSRWQDEPATQKQYSYIRKLGFYGFEENMTKAQASKVISMIKAGEASAINMFTISGNPQEIY